MKYVLTDTAWKRLLPLTFTRPVSELYIGIDTLGQKWNRCLRQQPEVCVAGHLRKRYPIDPTEQQTLVNSSVVPTESLAEAIRTLPEGMVLTNMGQFVAAHCTLDEAARIYDKVATGQEVSFTHFGKKEMFFNEPLIFINTTADLFHHNDAVLRLDFDTLTRGFRTTQVPGDVIVKGTTLHVEEGAVLNHCVLNTTTGPIYIGRGAEVMEGSMIRGPFALGEGSVVKMGAKIYGATTIGPHCRVGGELNNVIMHPYSNKGHDGFTGNSVIGSWCNLGADTNTSNLKNNYGEVKVWRYDTGRFDSSGRQFHGLIMGDHSKAGINTMFNTGTVVGVCANIYDGGFPPKFIPGFSWGSASGGFETFKLEKAFEAMNAMMLRRNQFLTDIEKEIFRYIYDSEAGMRQELNQQDFGTRIDK